MKKFTKVILLSIMFIGGDQSFAQWSFSMSFSYVGRDCGNLHSIETTINQRLRESMSGVQYPTREQCMTERSVAQSIIDEINKTYNMGVFDCKLVWTLGGCIGNDMSSNTLQLGVSKDAVFQSSNPANEVNDWVALHDSLIAIMGKPTKYGEPLAQTGHIKDFIEGLDQIEHVYTPQETYYGKPEERIIPDNYKLATDHDAPTMPEPDFEKVIITPKMNFNSDRMVQPVSKKKSAEFFSTSDKLSEWKDNISLGKDVVNLGSLMMTGKKLVNLGSATVSATTGILIEANVNLWMDVGTAIYKGAKGEAVIIDGKKVNTEDIGWEILKHAGEKTVKGILGIGLSKVEGKIASKSVNDKFVGEVTGTVASIVNNIVTRTPEEE